MTQLAEPTELPDTIHGLDPVTDLREIVRVVTANAYASYRITVGDEAPSNHCIETTRLLVEVFNRIGIPARAVPVDVVAFNSAALQSVLQHRPLVDAEVAAGAHTVGVHHSQPVANGHNWSGHLVTVIRNPAGGRVLIDAATSQFNRPDHQIAIAEVCALVIARGQLWAPGAGGAAITDRVANRSGYVAYWPMPPGAAAANEWRHSNAWNSQVVVELAEQVVASITA